MTRTPVRQRRSVTSIGQILDAAEALMAHAGQNSFTAAELFQQAGMSIGRIYYWYRDLASVIDAVVDRIAGDIDSMVPPTDPNTAAGWLQDPIAAHPAMIVLATSGPPHGPRTRLVDVLATALHQVLDVDSPALPALLGTLIDSHRHDTDVTTSESMSPPRSPR